VTDNGVARLAIRPGVAAIVRDDFGRVLLHRRVVGDGWAPPSGSVEPGEQVTDPSYQIVEYPDGHSVHFVTCLFDCQAVSGELHGSDEGNEWEWFDPRSLPNELLPYSLVWLRDAQDEDRKLKIR
jgi:8-oxo-dGTP diphosphatase